MSFGEAVKSVFGQYATFSGRARRSEYWYFVLCQILVGVALGVVALILGEGVATGVESIWTLATLIPNLAVTWRRLHDIGKSGLWYFIFLVPVVGWIILLIWVCKDSEPGDNQYGPNPKGF